MLAQRQLQTRRFDTTDEQKILKTCAALLQDTGFTIDESEAKLGIMIASKGARRNRCDAVGCLFRRRIFRRTHTAR